MKALPLSCLVFCLVFSAAAQAADASEKIFELEILQGAPPAKPRVLRVEKDDSVRIRVMSEVAGEIHLHGYRLEMKLAPGTPRELAFIAAYQWWLIAAFALGGGVGDWMTRQMARRALRIHFDLDLAARVGGDELSMSHAEKDEG